jgi:hypothetical protein
MDNVCSNCKYWERIDKYGGSYGRCSNSMVVYDHAAYPYSWDNSNPITPTNGIGYSDQEEYEAHIWFGTGFGCIHWTSKPPTELPTDSMWGKPDRYLYIGDAVHTRHAITIMSRVKLADIASKGFNVPKGLARLIAKCKEFDIKIPNTLLEDWRAYLEDSKPTKEVQDTLILVRSYTNDYR